MKKRDKKALSVMIGYILLITFGIVLSVIVYAYLKTYVPKEFLKCPEGVSIFIEEVNCSDNATTSNRDINLTMENNGKFNLAGYFIHATNSSDQEVATIDLSQEIIQDSTDGPVVVSNSIIFTTTSTDVNSFKPNNETTHYFVNISENISQIEIIPIRYETKGSTQRLASCGNSRVWEISNC